MSTGGSPSGGGGSSGSGTGGGASYLPTRKVAVGGLAGALSVVLVWLVNTFWMPSGQTIPPEIASALTTILTFLVSYFVPNPSA